MPDGRVYVEWNHKRESTPHPRAGFKSVSLTVFSGHARIMAHGDVSSANLIYRYWMRSLTAPRGSHPVDQSLRKRMRRIR